MRIYNYTNIWAVERKLYSFGDMNLPTPVSFKAMGIFVAAGTLWWGLLWVLHVPLDGPWLVMLWFVPPGIVASIWSKRLVEGKTLPRYIQSQVLFLLEPSRLYDVKETELWERPTQLRQRCGTPTRTLVSRSNATEASGAITGHTSPQKPSEPHRRAGERSCEHVRDCTHFPFGP